MGIGTKHCIGTIIGNFESAVEIKNCFFIPNNLIQYNHKFYNNFEIVHVAITMLIC